MEPRYLNRQQLKRVNPFEGLMIDAAAWAEAHEYHRDQQRLHSLAMHHAGIVTGLEVTANPQPDQSVIIHPGLAVDPEGNIILVTRAQRYHLQPKERGLLYLIIEFREVGTDRAAYDGDQPTRILEAYRIQQRENLPDSPYVELARVLVQEPGMPLRDAKDPCAPGPGEIDCRFRLDATVRPQGDLSMGLLVPKAGGAHSALAERGLRNLARELGLASSYRALYRGAVELGKEAGHCDLLYMAGSQSFSFDQYELTALGGFLESGGVLMGESCHQGREGSQGGGFEVGFKVLADRLGCRLSPVARGHPLLEVRHAFALPPEGASPGGDLLEGGGIVYSGMDYGCAWAGGHDGRLLGRAAIRDALELGVNVAAYAASRRRRVGLQGPSS